jgi:16S rRNA (guanine527-N7)-methyltransferase
MTLCATLDSLRIDRSFKPTLEAFVELFAKWNRSINLSAASTRSEVLEHLTDSLHVVPHIRDRARILDVGSGGGFPVVVAAICLPGSSFVSLEPVHKKHAFLRTAARELGLANLDALAMRLDDHEVRDYDAAMSRATFDLAEWIAMGLERVNEGGIVLGFEGIERSDLPAGIERHRYELDGKQRAIVIARR